jgi:hypothetical protein
VPKQQISAMAFNANGVPLGMEDKMKKSAQVEAVLSLCP